MDPDANLAEQLMLSQRIKFNYDEGFRPNEEDSNRLAELVVALDEWISKGGFLPAKWRKR